MPSRSSKSLKNIKVSLVFLLLTTLVNFISRAVFIEMLGDTLIGLSVTLINVLGFLNLAELGLSGTIAATLYKPLTLNDKEAACNIVSIYGFLYRRIGLIFLSLGLLISPFLPYFFEKSGVDMIYVFCGYFTYISTSLLGYFINYRQTILSADQKEYHVNFRNNTIIVIRLVVQMAVLKYCTNNFLIWLVIELVFAIVYSLWINHTVNKLYPWLITSYQRGKEVAKEYKYLFKTVKQAIPHSIAAFVLFQTDNILIYAYSSLAMVTLYTNYTLIISRATIILNSAFRGVGASIGNLVNFNDKEYINCVFLEFNALFFILAAVTTTTFYFQTDAFISLWVGDEFIIDRPTFILLLYVTYIGIIRLPISYFLGGYVLYKDVWAPITEAVINLAVSLVCGYYWGVVGVVTGTAVSLTVIVLIWKPIFLYREAFKESSLKYWLLFGKYLLIFVVTFIPIYLLNNSNILPDNTTWIGFFVRSIIIAGSTLAIYFIISLWTDKGTKYIVKRTCSIVKR